MAEKNAPKDVLEWLHIERAPEWAKASWVGACFAFLLSSLWLLALLAAFVIVIPVALPVFKADASGLGAGVAGLGGGALIVALLSAPFLVWRTVIAQRDLNFKKEGHITDRISKAVEQLGAEKKTERIGRPVVVWTGKTEIIIDVIYKGGVETSPPRTMELKRTAFRTAEVRSEHSIVHSQDAWRIERRKWPSERTVIEWQGKPLEIGPDESIGSEGEWKVFSETVPNIEVRIGGILSLERIAQDSTAYDHGRDHVRCMEILCAYIRENAPASSAKNHPDGDWEPLEDDAPSKKKAAYDKKRKARFDILSDWIIDLPSPREDIALALKVIGRRTHAQRLIEANWPNPGPAKQWVFDLPVPELPATDGAREPEVIERFQQSIESWANRLHMYNGYRPDLRYTNLQKAALDRFALSGALLDQARLDGASIEQASLKGARLIEARLERASLAFARLDGACLDGALLCGANLDHARLDGASLGEARLESASLDFARLDGASLSEAWFENAWLYGAHLEGASLALARLDGASIKNANLSDCQDLWQEQIDNTLGNKLTKLPKDLSRPTHWEADEDIPF